MVSKGFELPEELAQEALVALVRQCIKPGEVSMGTLTPTLTLTPTPTLTLTLIR